MSASPRFEQVSPHLSEAHQASLLSSSIDRVLVERRGYRTVTTKADLKSLGFAENQLLVPSLLIPIFGVNGEVAGYQARPDNPRLRDGKPVKYETPRHMRMVLDVPPSVRHLLGNPDVPLFVTEGIKKGDALASRDLCAGALLGVWNWRGTNATGGKLALPDWDQVALNDGRLVYIVFDSDVMLKPAVHTALGRLKGFLESKGANVAVIYLPPGPNGAKQGVDDFLAAGSDVAQLQHLASSDLLPLDDTEAEDDDQDRKGTSMATAMLDIAKTADLFHDEKGDAYAAIAVKDHRETWPVRSSSFKRWLARSYYVQTGKAPRAGSIADALTVIEARAQFEGDQRRTWTRTAEGDDGCIYLDLGDETWRAVKLTVDGWTVVDGAPVHFVRGPASAPMQLPRPGGALEDLKELINFGDEDDYRRVVGWLIGALRPRGPYPVLAFVAEQGSGKSAAARFLRSVVDPSAVPLRGMPRDERDLVIAARANHVIALDNVSNLPQWLSDALCRMATGGGWATRRLYTDADEEIFTQSRPVLITGIEDYVSNGDLLDRTMLVNLPTISPADRRQETELESDFEQLQPRLLGALLEAACAALRNVTTTELLALPRMADFAAWVVAAEPVLCWPQGAFLDSYMAGASATQDVVLEASLLGEPLRGMVEELGTWTGTSNELLTALATRVADDVKRQRNWPKTARGISGALRRLAPTLREVGVDVSFDRSKTAGRKRLITLEVKVGGPTVQTVQPSTDEQVGLDSMDGLDGSDPDFLPYELPSELEQEPEPQAWEMEVNV